ncbi:MAG TPA: SEL1-like repeat protein [Phycisphaerae bacterium]|nr:SEL1-like repeat protein [Phycisphaerae bacterium]
MRRAVLVAIAVVMAGAVWGVGVVVRGAGDEGTAAKGGKVDEGRKAKALELVKKAGMTAEDDGDEQLIRENVGVVAAALGDEALLKSAVDDEPNRWRKIQIYTSAAHEQAARGNVAGAKKSVAAAVALLGNASTIAPAGEKFQQLIQLQNVAGAQLDIGDLRGAEATAARMRAGVMQAGVFAEIGSAETKAGDVAAAGGDFDRAENIFGAVSAEDRIDDWDVLASEEAGASLDRAKKLLARMKDPKGQAEAAARIAGELAQGDQTTDAKSFIEAALASLRRVGGDADAAPERAVAEESLAETYAALGDKKTGMEMLGKAEADVAAEKIRPSALELLILAIAQDRLGRTDESDRTLTKVFDALPSDDRGDRQRALWQMSYLLAACGNVRDATNFVDKARAGKLTDDDVADACATARLLAESDGEDAKLDWIERLGEQAPAGMKRELYAAAARGMVESGENPKVRRFEAMAAAGDAEAMARLGAIFDAGLGVAKDMTAARSWYQKAAGAGDMEAADWLKAHPE